MDCYAHHGRVHGFGNNVMMGTVSGAGEQNHRGKLFGGDGAKDFLRGRL